MGPVIFINLPHAKTRKTNALIHNFPWHQLEHKTKCSKLHGGPRGFCLMLKIDCHLHWRNISILNSNINMQKYTYNILVLSIFIFTSFAAQLWSLGISSELKWRMFNNKLNEDIIPCPNLPSESSAQIWDSRMFQFSIDQGNKGVKGRHKNELVHTTLLYSKLVPNCPLLTHTWLLLYWGLPEESEYENYLANLAVLVGF